MVTTMSEHQFEFKIPHKVLEQEIDGQKVYAIRLQEDPFRDIIYSYGRVSFNEDEENDRLSISFEYDLLEDNDQEYDTKEFQNYIGELLQEMIMFEMGRNNLIFTGGTDETRNDDSKQPSK